MRIYEISEQISRNELAQIEEFANKLWSQLGVDVEFTYHLFDRVNDERNGEPITMDELVSLFQKAFVAHGTKIANMKNSAAVLRDLLTNINVPFALKVYGKQKKLVAQTVMRKKNFLSRDPMFRVK